MLRIVRPRSSYRRLLSLRPLLKSRPWPSLPLLSQNSTHNPVAKFRAIHTGPKEIPTKTSNEPKVDLNTFLGPSLPSRVYNLWFQHVPDEQSLTLPTPEVFKPWFTKDATFDLECATQFKPILEAIHQAHPESQTQAQAEAQAEQILDLVKPSSPLDWLGLVILLDQLPRNCYRGEESALVFTFFDPISQAITLRALEQNIPSSPELRYRLALRHWFYLPLMHSEDLRHQDLCLEKYREMDEDVRRLLAEASSAGLSEKQATCREVLAKNREAVNAISAQNLRFQKEHHDIIAQFGRYPYRNKALKRKSTPEEEKFLTEMEISFG
ncbi:hypothetical protein ASPCAL02167 [Aspergillus calidoustus]|uniref:DUF924-domain-containing protein n=1 Tax=Aspergillus calidoustus TaxID=454130 RepID=A0A0U5GM49_ASPCI|nr:hypothetical protein ASPCAL02167 [Aspergillus calidoustus]